MFVIKTKNPNFNEERLGLKFKDGIARTKDKALAIRFKTDFVYDVMSEGEFESEKTKQEPEKSEGDDVLKAMADEAIRATGATSQKDLGKVMKLLAPQVQATGFDLEKVKEMVTALLGGGQ